MFRRVLLAGTALAICVIGACNSNSEPVGTPGTVTVRAFIDADGSGAFSTGDAALAGSVTLTPLSGTPQQATLDATGMATFQAVTPGSYSVTFNGTLPAGAVLATAPSPTVVVPFQGGTIASQFRYVLNPGSVSGILYRDDNGNGVYDAGTDTPAAGLAVAIFATPDTTVVPVATTTTGANGQFLFSTLRPGTYTVRVTPIPTIQIVGGVLETVTVAAAAVAQTQLRFTGNLVSTIAQVRTAANGATVAFVGVATQNAGLLASNNLYVQDATGGVLVFGAPTAGILAGDTIRVIGATSTFSGELEIAAPSGGTLTVTKLGSGPVPAPRAITVTQMLSNQFLGQLIAVSGATVRNVTTTGTTSYNVTFQGNTAADTFLVRVGNTNNIPILSTFWQVGRSYNVTGLDGIFNGETELKPRAASDVVVGALALSIAQARAHPANDTVTVIGVVYAGTGVYTLSNAANLSVYIEDPTGGSEVFNIPPGTTYVAGDSLSVQGLVTFFDGEYEIARFTAANLPVINKLGTGAIPQPKTITPSDFAAKIYDGQLIRVEGLQVVSVSTPNASGAYNVVCTAPDGSAVTVRIDASPVGITNTFWQVGTRYDVAGAALNFSTNGTTFTPEVKPRSPADVAVSVGTVQTIASAKTALNDTVTVEGIVTAGRGTFRVDNAYIEDGTSGTQIFNLPLSLTLNVGDAVRVHGKMVLFSNENELENNISPTDSLKVTKLGPGGAPAPKVITGVQFLARTFEGELVTLQNVAIVTVGTAGGTGTYTVTGTTPDNSTVTIFMSAPTGAVPTPAATYAVGSHYDITGIAVPFGTPASAELKPRGAADVVAH
ncbi:MAG TPA: SdrD B-like domain-containing protein [Gemmatimonadales bacterium]|jgi:hypothetical protein|nr:SdrD B-like domain-containing protein [Gemmatimonadales bacterium]